MDITAMKPEVFQKTVADHMNEALLSSNDASKSFSVLITAEEPADAEALRQVLLSAYEGAYFPDAVATPREDGMEKSIVICCDDAAKYCRPLSVEAGNQLCHTDFVLYAVPESAEVAETMKRFDALSAVTDGMFWAVFCNEGKYTELCKYREENSHTLLGGHGYYRTESVAHALHGLIAQRGMRIRRHIRRKVCRYYQEDCSQVICRRIDTLKEHQKHNEQVKSVLYYKYLMIFSEMKNSLCDTGDYFDRLAVRLKENTNPEDFWETSMKAIVWESKEHFAKWQTRFLHAIRGSKVCMNFAEHMNRVVVGYVLPRPVIVDYQKQHFFARLFRRSKKPIYNDFIADGCEDIKSELLKELRNALQEHLGYYVEEYYASAPKSDSLCEDMFENYLTLLDIKMRIPRINPL